MDLSALYLFTHNSRRRASYSGPQREKSYDNYGLVLLQSAIEKRVLGMAKTREEALARSEASCVSTRFDQMEDRATRLPRQAEPGDRYHANSPGYHP
jgi:hypothetical protein